MNRSLPLPGIYSMPLGRWFLSRLGRAYLNNIKARANCLKLPDIAANIQDYITNDIILYGYWEINEIRALRFLADRLSLGGVFIDVGANIGCYSMALGVLFAHVIAFEPCAENFSMLMHNLKFNTTILHSAYQVALGSEYGRAEIESNMSNRGGAKIINFSEKAPLEPVKDLGDFAEVFQLDEFLVSHADGIDGLNIDLLKIDVEGFEDQVIKGSLGTIETHQPVIAFEYMAIDGNTDHFSILEDLGYQLMVLQKERRNFLNSFGAFRLSYALVPVKKSDIFARNKHVNLIFAIPPKFVHLLG